MNDAGHSGNGHGRNRLDELEDELGALNEDLGQQTLALQQLIGIQERFQEQVVKDVAEAVAALLEKKLTPVALELSHIRASITELHRSVGDLAQAVNVALRRA